MTKLDRKIFVEMFKLLFRGILSCKNWDSSLLTDYKHFENNDLKHWLGKEK